MKKVVTAEQMQKIDRKAIHETGVPGLILMENAGLGVARKVEDLLKIIGGDTVVIYCGKGNNGGDGLVAARHLFKKGFTVNVYLAGEKEKLKGDAVTNLKMLEGFKVKINEIKSKKDLKKVADGDIIIDALLGTGIKGEVKGFLSDVIKLINDSPQKVISIDIPSGLQCDDGYFFGACIKADYTCTMAELKCGLLLPPGRDMSGIVEVVDICSPVFAADLFDIKTFLIEKNDVYNMLPARPSAAHKGDFGKIAVLAGSPGMTGAAALSAQSALSVGAGLVVLGIPEKLNPILEEKLTEVMTKPFPQTEKGTLSMDAADPIHELFNWADTAAVGPGLTTEPETVKLIKKVVLESDLPAVIDADGLNAFKGEIHLLKRRNGDFIITPHFGELSRLCGRSIDEIIKNRIDAVRRAADDSGGIVVLKGSPTLIASPGGEVYINSTGNSGMATAGSGDVLTGMIAGFLGQGCKPLHAAVCGVFLHGAAGDFASADLGQRCMTAGCLIDYLPEAFQFIEEIE